MPINKCQQQKRYLNYSVSTQHSFKGLICQYLGPIIQVSSFNNFIGTYCPKGVGYERDSRSHARCPFGQCMVRCDVMFVVWCGVVLCCARVVLRLCCVSVLWYYDMLYCVVLH